jgi:release factor glutamine methyltransferase
MTDVKKQWKIIDILNTTTDYFTRKNISAPRLNAERLLSHLLQLERIQLYLQFDRSLSADEVSRFRLLVERRAKREPLQYIIGRTEFMGLVFLVHPAVLIPRPETEILVERTLDLKSKFGRQEITICDLGTGSGCIAVALAKLWPGCYIYATDISDEALQLAQKNAELNGVTGQISFIKHDIFQAESLAVKNIDILVSNPPYISVEELPGLDEEIRRYEPENALTDYGSGLRFYRQIFELIRSGLPVKYMMLELSGLNQDKIINLAKQFNYEYINTYKDNNDIIRILEITVK